MKTLAVIPSDPLDDYVAKGLSHKLERYYNPAGFFDKVYCLSPLESARREAFGMEVIPTKDRQLPGRIKELGISLVRAYGGNWPCDMACRFRVSHIPVAVSLHDRREKWFRHSLSRADAVFALTPEIQATAVKYGARPERVWLFPNKVDFDVMKPLSLERSRFQISGNVKVVAFAGRLSPEKNLDGLIRAVSRIDDCVLLIAGDGDRSTYEALAKDVGAENRIRFLGTLDNREVAELFNAADCVCQPSHTEALSLALIEALACGAVVVTSQVAAAGVGIEDKYNGLIIPDVKDSFSIAATLQLALRDGALRDSLRTNARPSVKRFETAEAEAIEVAYYQRLLDEAQRGMFSRPFGDQIHWLIKAT